MGNSAKIDMKEEIKKIISELPNSKNLPNKKLVEYLETLSNEFDATKVNMINLSYELDTIEEAYNKLNKEYTERNNG